MTADLHLHTHYSDGTYGPAELVREAQAHELAVIALTDHDTVEGCAPTAALCRQAGLGFIPGTELTAELDDQELHILGYYIDIQDRGLLGAMARFQQVRQDRIRSMVERLNGLGIGLEAEAVLAAAACRSPGRPHVGRALVAVGACASVDEAFDRFLKKGRPAWAPKMKITAAEAIDLIHGAGGLAVMAHPALNRLDHRLADLVAAGLDGLECYHSKHASSVARHYLGLAAKYDLLITGGSDCHGMTKGQPLIGTVRVPIACVEAMAARLSARRR